MLRFTPRSKAFLVSTSRRYLPIMIVATLLLIISAVVAIYMSVAWMHARQIDDKLDDASRTLESISIHIASRYQELDDATKTFVELVGNRDLREVDVQELLIIRQQIERPHLDMELQISIWQPDGSSLFSDTQSMSIADRGFFKVHADTATAPETYSYLLNSLTGLVIGEPIQNRIQNGSVLPVSRAIRSPDGKLLAVVVASVPVERMLEMFEALRRNTNDVIFFMRNDRMGMVRLPHDDRFTGRILPNALAFQNYPAQPIGRFEGPAQTDGIRRVGVHRTLEPLPLVAAISLEVRALEIDSLRRYLPFIGISFVQLFSVLVFAVLAYILLARSLGERDKAKRSELRLSTVLSAAGEGIVLLDPQMRIRGFNAAAERIFGWKAADVVGGPLDPLIPASARGRHKQHMEEFAGGNVEFREMKDWRAVRGVHRDGRMLPVLVAISRAHTEEETIFLAVVRDMSEVAANEAMLIEKAREAQRLREVADRASQAKSLFLATMSHELRTPLNAIIGFSEALQQGIAGPIVSAQQREYLGYVVTSGRHLLEIINDIIDISRLQSGSHLIHMSRVNVWEVIDAAAKVLKHRLEEKKIAFQLGEDDCSIEALADARALRQVLINVIGNAVKFSPEAANIRCVLRRKETKVLIEIRDSGPGMAAAVMDRIGTPFNQERDLVIANNDGVGLGLAISVGFVNEMGGRMTFKNQSLGGLCVTIELNAID